MEEINIHQIQTTVLACMFAVGVLFGFVSERTHFCTRGALADLFNFGSWGRMRMWVLAIAIATTGLQTMSMLGLATLSDTLFIHNNWYWLSALTGGLLFGVGMVLASGCGSKTLVRLGTGNLKALLVFLIMGIAAYMALKGVVGVFRVTFLDPVQLHFTPSSFIPALLSQTSGLTSETAQHAIALSIPLVLFAWVFSNKSAWNRKVILGGVGVGVAVLAAWWVVFQIAYLPEHPDTLEKAYLGTYSNRAEALSFVAPYAYTLEWLMFFSDQSRVLTVGVVACMGVIVGAAISSLLGKTFRWEAFHGVEDMANHITGALFMGIGGVLALGCTVGQGLSGVSTLSLSSWLTLLAIVAGGFLGLKYQAWRVERMV